MSSSRYQRSSPDVYIICFPFSVCARESAREKTRPSRCRVRSEKYPAAPLVQRISQTATDRSSLRPPFHPRASALPSPLAGLANRGLDARGLLSTIECALTRVAKLAVLR